MASAACKKQLNAQLQIMDARLKAAEKNIGVLVKGLTKLTAATISATGTAPNDFTVALLAMASTSGNALASGWNNFIDLVPSVDSDAIQGAAITAAVASLGAVGQYVAPIEAAISQVAELVINLEAQIQVALSGEPPNYILAELLGRKISDLQVVSDGLTSAMVALDNIAKCKSSSLMVS